MPVAMEVDYSPSRFELLHKIGEGVHGVVVKAIDLECNNKLVAIKRVALRNKYGSIATNTIREIKSLQQCDNENVSLGCLAVFDRQRTALQGALVN